MKISRKQIAFSFLLNLLLFSGAWGCLSSNPGAGGIGPQDAASAPDQAIGSGDQMTPNSPVGVVAPGTGGNTDLGNEKTPCRVEKETNTSPDAENGGVVIQIKGIVGLGDPFRPCCGGTVIRVVDLIKNQYVDTRLSEKKIPQGPLDPILSEGHFEVNFSTVEEASFKFFVASENPSPLVLDSMRSCETPNCVNSSWKEMEAVEGKIKIKIPLSAQPAAQGSGKVKPKMQAAEPSD